MMRSPRLLPALAAVCALAIVAAAGAGTAPSGDDAETVRTTDAGIAMGNLEAQIRQLERARWDALAAGQRAGLIDLITAHARYTGRISELDRALSLAEGWAIEQPAEPAALLARARARAGVHRFAAALADLERAAALGASPAAVAGVRAGIHQATGRYAEALALRRAAVQRHPSSDNLGALASLQAERGEVEEAARLFAAARREYRDVSPFPLAFLLFDEGAMWMRHGDLGRARDRFAAALRHLPSYATARCHLAEVEAALGRSDRAIALLTPLAESSDDPDAAGQLARVLAAAGDGASAEQWRRRTAQRYDALLARYPDAFADHAAEFWLAAGRDPQRALALAQHNLALRQTPRAYELVISAALAGGRTDVACSAAARARGADDHSEGLTAALAHATTVCN